MRYCFCIVGWHFLPQFYEAVYQIQGDKYIISHRDRQYVEKNATYPMIKNDLFFCENIGLDWGGYHQFNEKEMYKDYAFVIYCHDDILIKDSSFVLELIQKFSETNIKIVGNGRNGTDYEFKFSKYKDRMFFPDYDDFVVRTVRGSFFAAKTEIFSHIGNFPVYWHTKKLKHGNISLRNFGYLVTKHFGVESITYLDTNSWLETQYIKELRRGAL